MSLPISLLTDYGTADEFAGVVKGVLTQIAPQSRLIDVTHQVPAFDVRAGSLALSRAIQYLPDGVVFAVVDPGVGSTRRAVAVQAADMMFVGPDNGLLAPAVALLGGAQRAVSLTNTALHLPMPGVTFAGRDVFAPVAAHLATGSTLDEVGEEIDPATLTPGMIALSRIDDDELHGEVLWVDAFGNAQLNVDPADLDAFAAGVGDVAAVRIGDRTRVARRAATYADIRSGEVGLVVDSYGLVSICMDRRSASEELGCVAGTGVVLSAIADDNTTSPGVTQRVQLSPRRDQP
jgi:S-adenosyl-L-methionine hydrolase (adenosine-forming)